MTHLLRAARRAGARRCRGESGFTLVEVVVAMGILVIAMMALLSGMIAALQGAVLGRANQQAGDVANAELERIRSFDYGQITLANGDVTIPAVSTYEGQPLSKALSGAVQPASTTFSADNRLYTVQRWVTDDTTTAGRVTVRRVTVEVGFTANGVAHTRKASTLVTATRRGLPLPNYRFDYNGSAPLVAGSDGVVRYQVSAAPDSDADFGFTLRNLGARDTWNLTASQLGWSFYRDLDQNGVFDTGEPLLTDTDGNGQVDTGPIEPSTAPVYLVAFRDVPAGESIGVKTVRFTATSSAQPSIAGKFVDAAVNVTTAASAPTPAPTPTSTSAVICTGGTPTVTNAAATTPMFPGGFGPLTLTLQNASQGDSTTRALMNLSRDTSTQPGHCNFSTELQTAVSGRASPLGLTSAWDYTPIGGSAKDATFKGTGVARIWVRCPPGLPVTVTATFGLKSTATHAATGSTTIAASDCNGSTYRSISVSVPGIDVVSSKNPVQLRIQTSSPATLMYDAPSTGAYFVVGSRK